MNHAERKHAVLSPSGASRWMNCTPSARLAEKFENKTSVFAQEGTLAHEFADLQLRHFNKEITKRKLNAEVKKLKENELYASEMDRHVAFYVDFIKEKLSEAATVTGGSPYLSIEEQVDLSFAVPESSGSCDAIIIADRRMYVIDLKYGKGVTVDAGNNPQLRLYALGALNAYSLMYDIHEIESIIVQPRLDHISSEVMKVEDLYSWAQKEVKPKAKQAFKGEGVQCAGSWCKFCLVKPKCATLASMANGMAKHEFKSPHLLTDSQLTEVYEKQKVLIDWFKSVGEHMLSEALKGKSWAGFKIVEGVSRRRWKSEKEVEKALQNNAFGDDEIFETKLKSLTNIEKMIGKPLFNEILSALVEKPQGKPQLVENSDKRPPFVKVEQAKEVFK